MAGSSVDISTFGSLLGRKEEAGNFSRISQQIIYFSKFLSAHANLKPIVAEKLNNKLGHSTYSFITKYNIFSHFFEHGQ